LVTTIGEIGFNWFRMVTLGSLWKRALRIGVITEKALIPRFPGNWKWGLELPWNLGLEFEFVPPKN